MSSFLNHSHKSREILSHEYIYVNKSVLYFMHFLLHNKVNALYINIAAKLHNPKHGLHNRAVTLTVGFSAWFL